MVSEMCLIASVIVLATFASSSAAWAATRLNASLSGHLRVYARRHRQWHPLSSARARPRLIQPQARIPGRSQKTRTASLAPSLSPQHTQSPRTAPSQLESG
jgi:hypothetical protein